MKSEIEKRAAGDNDKDRIHTCGLCLDSFSCGSTIYELSWVHRDGAPRFACPSCVDQDEQQIVYRIENKIKMLKYSKRILREIIADSKKNRR